MVVYKIDAVTAWIAQNVFKFSVKHISLVNLILEEQVILRTSSGGITVLASQSIWHC